MDSTEIIKIYTSEFEFKETCIKNNISLFNFRYLEFERQNNINNDKLYSFIYITYWINKELIGVLKQVVFCGFKYNDFVLDSTRTISYITINDRYQNLGYSKKIVEYYFSFLKEKDINEKIYISPYSKSGWNFLRKNLHEYAKKYNFILIDKNYCYEC